MKVISPNSGLLTNFEVLKLLNERGASNSELAGTANGPHISECKVYNYLMETPAGTQNSESLRSFLEASKKFSLFKPEILQVINLRPTTEVDVHLVVECLETRLPEHRREGFVSEFIEIVERCLPPPPVRESLEDEEEGEDADDEEGGNDAMEES